MKSKYIVTLCLYLMYSSTVIYGQDCKIRGIVQDERNAPMEYVSVGIYQDEQLLSGTITNAEGEFLITTTCNDNYTLKVRYIGYQEIQKEVRTDGNIQGLSFQLSITTNELETVTIIAQKPVIERKTDRLIYFVEKSLLVGNHSALEVLKTTPSVWVDGNGGIRINGKTGTRVMINGKLLNLNGQQLRSYLNGIDGNQIVSIEVISIPGSEYDAESKGGIINIIVKKKFLDGFNASTYAGYEKGKYNKYSGGVFSNYKKGKLTTTANFYIYDDASFVDVQEDRNNPDTQFNLASSSYTKIDVSNHQLRLGADYDINKFQNINFEHVRTFNQNDLNVDAIANLRKENTTSRVIGKYNTRSTNLYQGTSLNYKWQTDTLGSELKILLDYVDNENKTNGLFASDYFDENSRFINNNTTSNSLDQFSKIFSGKLDYQYILTTTTVKVGIKYSRSDIINDAIEKDKIDNIFVIDAARTNLFNYDESIMAAYLNISGGKEKLQYKVGLRLENSNIKGTSEAESGNFDTQFLDWFPSAYLLWQFGENNRNALSFAANRRINRPSFDALNPFAYVINEFTIHRGNPLLRPEYTNNVEVNYSLFNKYSLGAYYSKTNDVINRILIANQNLAIYQNENISQQTTYGVNLNIPFAPIKQVLYSSVYLSYYNSHFKSDKIDAAQNTYSLRFNNSLSLKNDFRANFSLSYTTKDLYGNILYDPYGQFDISLSKPFMDKKLRVSLGITDLFNMQNNSSELLGSRESIITTEKYQSRRLQLYLFYNLNIGKSFNKKRIEYSTEGEKSRLRN